ncbi:hypothetical protein LWI29_001727 [Acer saccharum]|uniref:BHLH domain-containing protein n=1 Tax=Acer saccharum TaxID=4024 RepID=A0AA39TCR5_ACESA|nr:hypothetical protein LWI29_001727 [Acer saccharum]
MYEYEKWYEECCLRCQNQNCRRAFHGVAVPEPKNDILVEGGDHYYCGLGLFPLKYSGDGSNASGYNANDVVVISDSDDDNGDGEAIGVNNAGRKVDVRVNKAKEEENLKSGEKGCLGVMQGSGKTEEINGGKRRMHVKSVGRKSKVIKRRDVKSKRMESMNEPGAKGLDLNVKFGQESNGDAHEREIGSGTGDGCFEDTDLEFFEKDGDIFLEQGVKPFQNYCNSLRFSKQISLPRGGITSSNSVHYRTTLSKQISKAETKELAAKKHSDAERRRRLRINDQYSTLRTTLPNLVKGRDVYAFPSDANQLNLCYSNDNTGLLKAVLSCEDKSALMSDLTRAVKSVKGWVVKAEMVTVGGRTKCVLWVQGLKGNEGMVVLKRALNLVINRSVLSAKSKKFRFYQ